MIYFIFSTATSFCMGMLLCIPSLSFLNKEWNKYTHDIQEVVFPKHPVLECWKDVACRTLGQTAYYEARGEDDIGAILVMRNVLNRVEHSCWKDNIKAVVYSPKQYSFTHDGSTDKPVNWDQMVRMLYLANNLLSGDVNTPEEWSEITHYHSTRVNPKWAKKKEVVLKHGNHIFYKTRRKCK